MANSILAKMAVQISANTAEFNKALAKTNKDITSFTGGISSAAKAIGVAFGAQQIASFAFDMAKLAGEAEAVSIAFNRLESARLLLRDLKEATHGTVSELELMKRAVQASNFDISLKALPRLLEFATLRAQQTGQSVDYLVDSIVTGIGRKSKLILDNLGISAEQLKQEFHGASLEAQSVGDVAEAVGRIAEKNLQNMAGFSQNAATSVQQLAAAWEDLKVSVGNLINKSGLPSFVKEMAELARFFSGDFTLSKEQVKKTEEALGELIKKSKELGNQSDVMKYSKMLAELASQYRLLKDQALEPTIQKFEKQKTVTKQLTDSQRALNDEIERMGRIAKLERDLAGPKDKDSAGGTLVDPDSIKKQIDAARMNLKMLPTDFKKVADEMMGISGLIVGGIVDIAAAFGEAAIEGPKNFGRAFLHSLATFAQQFGGLLIATGLGEIALRSGNPALMIAGGAALIAAGAAIKSLTRPSLSSGGSSGGSQSFPARPQVNENFQDFALSTSVSGTDLNIVMGNTNNRNRFTRP